MVVPSYVWIHWILPWVYSRLSIPYLCTRDHALVLSLGYLKPLDGSAQHLALPCALPPSAKCTGRPGVCLFCPDGWFPEVQLLRRAQQPALPMLM